MSSPLNEKISTPPLLRSSVAPWVPNGVAPSSNVYVGEEHGEVAVPLDHVLIDGKLDVFPQINSQGIFGIRLSDGRLVFQAGRYIGLIPINSRVTIDVRPRVPLKNLERLLIKSGATPKALEGFNRHFDSYAESFDALLDFFADALLASIKSIRQFGLYKEYVRREVLTISPKGRLNMTAIARRSNSSAIDQRLICSWYERTTDNPPNRCILTALQSLSRKYSRLIGQKGVALRLRQINEASKLFSGIHLDSSSNFLHAPLVENPEDFPDLRSYYSNAISISKAIILKSGISFSNDGNEFFMSSLMIDMASVFEGYVRNILINRFHSNGIDVVDGNRDEQAGGGKRSLFASEDRERLGQLEKATPDIVIFKVEELQRRPELVIDAKYKKSSPAAERNEINQVITYAVSYGAPKALLVMPMHSKTKPGLWYLGKAGAVRVYQFNFNLAAEDMEKEECQWAAAVKTLTERDPDFIL